MNHRVEVKPKEDSLIYKHLDWTSKQGRILTCEGKAEQYYTKERGFPFTNEELPHYHLMSNTTHEAFSRFCRINNKALEPSIICGAWTRPLFMGAWEHTTANDEHVYNLQTNTLFIDLRIPTTKPVDQFSQMLSSNKKESSASSLLSTLSDLQLRMYARQHVFSGYTVCSIENNRLLGTRHHCLDWNFVGTPRNRPNKWYVEPQSINDASSSTNHNPNVWKEWAYATNEFSQHYYCERWERIDGDSKEGENLVLAMRKSKGSKRDGVLVAIGDHFNFIHDRIFTNEGQKDHNCASLVDLVDKCIKRGDRKTAEAYLTIDAGHGRIHSGWEIDCAIQSWKHGTKLFVDDIPKVMTGGNDFDGTESTLNSCFVWWKGERWDIIECNLSSPEKLQALFRIGVKESHQSKL